MAVGKVRLKDVAERAGVAVNTASTILNKRPNSWASKETEERVFAAAKDLGYRPNRAAVALRSGSFKTVGLLVADLDNPYYTHFAQVFGNEIAKKGYDLVIENWQTDLAREKKLLEEVVYRNVDGVVAFVSDLDEHRDFLESQAKIGFPIVALAMPGAGPAPVDVVNPNFSTGLKEAATTLYDLGHRRFSFLAARSKGQRVGGRPSYFKKVVEEFGDVDAEVVDCGPSIREAREVGRRILDKDGRPSAVVALNDLAAIGVMRAAKDLGLRVPDDVSVVGIDGIPLGEQLQVSLSTVVQPYDEMVGKAIEFLLERIEGKGNGTPQHAEFPTRFIRRESVGRVRSAT
ncbi:LacI family transcriptional regulator [bacterium]|nr:LacI family transcriptional regulator [Akkermansiaceae bacterium]MDB4106738.1 LacI family transcriptional regulator [bacterium]MDB4142300.1 LacI family transcriptional regulator [Akkermansiaceae bacterium]MDB4274609.1 LacI family transcriptional regulator [Akkermansiaceae bacterium]MDB4287858.1 LacI family transcriptional regulator [bacterium]